MAKLLWTENLNTGIDIIDEQHKRIVNCINQLDDAIYSEQSRKKIAKIIGTLTDYTRIHFSFEENMQEKAGYPFLLAHKRLHGIFMSCLENFLERFWNGEDVSEELRKILFIRFINHIEFDDKDYVASVLENPAWQQQYGLMEEKSGFIWQAIRLIIPRKPSKNIG